MRIFDNFSRSDAAPLTALARHEQLSVVEGDIRDRPALDRAMTGVGCVVHLAAVCINKSLADPAECFEVNVEGSHNVFESASDSSVRRVIFASSASVYGNAKRLPTREGDALDPLTPYCKAKVEAEVALGDYAATGNFGWLALRFFNVYGPGQPTDAFYTSVVLTFLRRMAAREPLVIDSAGSQTMDLIHVDDVARAVLMAVESEASGHALNVGTGVQTSVLSLALALAAHLGVTAEHEFRTRPALVERRQADISKIQQVLGWVPAVDIDDGLATVIPDSET